MLPILPTLIGEPNKDIEILQRWIKDFSDGFANATGEAIDPIFGQSGDTSLVVTDVPGGVVYTPGSTLSVDGVLYGHIDVTFVLPSRAIGILVHYREQGVINFKTSFAKTSPWRLINLKVGTRYEIAVAGLAANGDIGPLSTVEEVQIDTSLLAVGPPSDLSATATYQSIVLKWSPPVGGSRLEYQVQRADDADFTTNVILYCVDATILVDDLGVIGSLKYYRVRSVDRAGTASIYGNIVSATTLNVPDGSIEIAKRSDLVNQTNSISITGNGGVNEILVQDTVFTHNLNKLVHVTCSLESITGEATNARFDGVFLIAQGLNSFTVRVTGNFFISTATLQCTLNVWYW